MSMLVNVTTLSELYDALASAKGVETIVLAGGNYGDLNLTMQAGFSRSFDTEVTITSADPGNPAVFTGMNLRDAANLTFDTVTFDYTYEAGDQIFHRPFAVTNSEAITIRNSTFDGDVVHGLSEVDDGYGYAIGLSVRDSENIVIEGNEFSEFHRAATFAQSSDITVIDNEVHSIRMDGFNFAEIQSALIEGNHIHNFRGSLDSGDHRDMIQFWTAGTDSPSTDIVIRGNHLDIGEGTYTQSIFIRNEVVDRGLAGPEMFYRNFVIEENVIVNGHSHGITVGETDGLVVANNTIVHADGDRPDGRDPFVEIPRINLAADSTNVQVHQNITADIVGYGTQETWAVTDNAFVQNQDSNAPGFYSDVFVLTSLTPADGMHQFRALEGTLVAALDAGASTTWAASQPTGLSAQFHITPDDDSKAIFYFDASFSLSNGEALPEGAEYLWDFGDGTTGTGAQITKVFKDDSAFDVNLTIVLPDGTQASTGLHLDVEDTALVSMLDGTDSTGQVLGAGAIALGTSEPAAVFAREDVASLLHQDEFTISMTIAADSTESSGEIMRLHGSFITSVDHDGALSLRVFTDTGEELRLKTEGIIFNDTQTHEIDITLREGVLSITADDELVATAQMSDTLASVGNHDLTFGNVWHGNNFAGTLSTFEISVNDSHFETPAPEAQSTVPQAVTLPSSIVVEAPQAPALPEHDADLIVLTGENVSYSIAREEVDHILDVDTFSVSFTLSAASDQSHGQIMNLHQSFWMAFTERGTLLTNLFDTDGTRIRMETEQLNLSDTTAHDIKLIYANDLAELYVNGDRMAYTDMEAPLDNVGHHDLTFGNRWKDDNFDGLLSNLEILSGADSFHMNAPYQDAYSTTPDYASVDALYEFAIPPSDVFFL